MAQLLADREDSIERFDEEVRRRYPKLDEFLTIKPTLRPSLRI